MSTFPSTQSYFKGLTSVMLEAVCGPEHMHEEGGDTHENIDERDSDEGKVYEDGNGIVLFTLAANRADLDISDD